MAHVEAAIVVHLRSLYYPDNPLRIFPLALLSPRDHAIELAREAATLLMIVAVALLAERHGPRRFAAVLYIFGLWDLFYYLWLKLMIGWPAAWLEWDVLFLIPWPWFGPWLAAAAIALMFVTRGASVLRQPRRWILSRRAIALFSLGAVAGVASFLAPAVSLLRGGARAFREFTPQWFPWWLYVGGLVLMAAGLWLGRLADGPDGCGAEADGRG